MPTATILVPNLRTAKRRGAVSVRNRLRTLWLSVASYPPTCPCRLFPALITLPMFDRGRYESVVLFALHEARAICGINSVGCRNVEPFRVMLQAGALR